MQGLAALMKSSTITAVGIFAVFVVLLFLLPQSTRQQLQAALFQLISPVLRTGESVQRKLGGVRGGLKPLDELERENQELKLENEQLRATDSLLNTLVLPPLSGCSLSIPVTRSTMPRTTI